MYNLIAKTRSFRRFEQSRPLSISELKPLIDLARLGGSARNCQPWQYMLITDPEVCKTIFPYMGWAGYLSDWKGPIPGEQPSAYVLCLLNRDRLKGSDKEAQFDLGIATQNMLLGAMEKGIGGCRIGAFSPKLSDIFEIPENLEISLVVALGYPAEKIIIEPLTTQDDIRYWRDDDDAHHVPKRSLEDLLVELKQK